ncbi:winged helix-turn-helix domain-containing protein [Roseomonas sp. HF4]|uniref:winged helix-turn-helix domain-containing protein n=1 Tax=Roseomonas sp. HF4 TaxID=2562313 RepID=UPI0010C0F2AD|nr:winged helix-turn-helix domain-containing protein [Roseomonas sp. HF4]
MSASPAHPGPGGLGKLSPPRLGRAFDRERLFAALDALVEYPGVWVAAPPGAGKTTLVATWLRARGRRMLWFQVDAGDADPPTFVASLDRVAAIAASRPLALPAFGADDLSDLAGSLSRRLRLLLDHLPPEWTLVLDNHQDLPPDHPLHHAIARLLGELPLGVQWLFVSREPPPPDYALALARQHLAVLDAEGLRFDEAETRDLVRLHGRPEAMAPALAAAEGWAAGLTLMLLGSPADAVLPAHGARERLFDFLAGEVLRRMTEAEQRALAAIAYLPSATASLARRVSGHADAPALLERLAASSLFTDRRDGPEPSYTFHALFSELLRRRLEATAAPEEVAALQRHAATVLIETGETDAALGLLAGVGAWAEAEAALRLAAPRYVAEGRTGALLRLIEALPSDARDGLAYWHGLCLLDRNPAAALPRLVLAHESAEAAGDGEAALAAAAGAANALVSLGRLPELDRWIAVLTRHADRAARPGDDAAEMRLVPGLLAAVVYHAPWHPLAEPLADRAERLLHLEAALGQRLLVGSLAFHLLWRGHVDRLDRVLRRIDALAAQGRAAPVTTMRWLGVSVWVKALLGRNAEALAEAEAARALVAAEPSLAAQRASAENMAVIAALGAVDGARARRHQELAAAALSPDNAPDRTAFEHHRGMLALLEDDRPTALRLMRAAVASARGSGFRMREHIALIANALAAAHADAHDEARDLLAEVFAHPFHAICRWHHWVAGCVAAYAALRRGDVPEALDHLRPAWRVARECGFRHGPMLFCCGDMMARLAALALEHGVEPEVAREVVLRNDLKAPPEAGAAWPWALRIRTLGSFEIERTDAPLPSSRKESRRLLELLRLLAAHGSTPLAQERVADALWPDSDGDAARNALDNALHRLRKMLGGDDRVLLRQGALQLSPQRCWTDVGALEALLARLETCPTGEIVGHGAAIRALYRAPLLPDEALPLVMERRAMLHRRVQRSLDLAAERLARTGLGEAVARLREPLPGP